MKAKRFCALALSVGLAVFVPLVKAEITVGVSLPLSGGAASLGVPSKTGLPFWPQEIAGEKLKVIVVDDAGDPAAATRNARKFVEDKVDVLVGTLTTPAAVAMTQVAFESQTPHFSFAPVEVADGRDAWTFRIAMQQSFYVAGIVDHMKRSGVKTIGFLGVSDALGETHLQPLLEQAKAAGMAVTAVERFARADTSVTAQALRLVTARPDAILIAASGGGSALPQKALKERGYTGKIYHGAAATSPDFIRLAGKDADGIIVVASPEWVADQLPESHPARKVALDFVQRYEAANGPGSRSVFAANTYEVGLILQNVIPVALKKGKPGTPEFRRALKNAIESMNDISVTKGELKYSATDHWGRGPSARVMVTVANGKWALAR